MNQTTEKHRFQLETEEVKTTKWGYDPELNESGSTVYLDESDPRYRSHIKFRIFLWTGLALLLLIGIGTGIYIGFFQNKTGQSEAEINAAAFGLKQNALDGFKEKFYLPVGNFSPELRRAIALYKANSRDQAKRSFENLVEKSGSFEEKAIASVYLGIMDLETDRLTLARHNFSRALRYNPKYIPALVNMAIVERRLDNLDSAKTHAMKAAEIAPNDPKIKILLGNISAGIGDFKNAIEAYREGLEKSPNDPRLNFNLALSLLNNKNYEEAILYFNRAIKAAGTGEIAIQSYAHMSQIYFFKNQFEMAADMIKKAISFAPNNGRYFYNLGVIYLRMKNNKEAVHFFKKALKAGSNESEVLRSLALAFQQLKQPALGIEALKKARYMKPDDLATLFQLADLYYEEKDLLQAADLLRKIINITPGDKNTEDALLKLGAVYVDLERYNDAIKMIEKTLRLNNKDVRAWFSLGIAYRRAGKKSEAIGAWKKALGFSKSDDILNSIPIERDDERMIRKEMARVYREEGAYELALRNYRLILATNKRPPVMAEDPEILLAIGTTYYQMKDYPSAISSLQKVTEMRSAKATQRRDAFLTIARAYSGTENREELDIAKSFAYKAARIAPGDHEAQLVQTSILLKTNSLLDRERAIDILRSITASDIEAKMAAEAHNLLGLAYYKNGEFSRALNSFDQSLQLNPTNKSAYNNQRLAASALEETRGN